MFVDVNVIGSVVFMRSAGLKHRHQIQRIHTKRTEVWKLGTQTGDIAAAESTEDKVFVEGLAVIAFSAEWFVPIVFPRNGAIGIVAGITVTKSVHHDLVPDRILGPCRSAERRGGGGIEGIDVGITHRQLTILCYERVRDCAVARQG